MFKFLKDLRGTYSNDKAAAALKTALHALVRYAFMPLAFLYCELLLRVLTGGDLTRGAPFFILFALFAGLLFSFISQLVYNRKAFRIINGIILGIIGVLFTLQYFMYQSFQSYMTFTTIIVEARNAVNNFTGVFLRAVLRGIPQILGFIAPLLLFILSTSKRLTPHEKAKLQRYTIAAGVFLLLTAGGCLLALRHNEHDRAVFLEEYNFESTGRQLGLLPGLSLDIWYSLSVSRPADTKFDILEIPHVLPVLPDAVPDNNAAGYSEIHSGRTQPADDAGGDSAAAGDGIKNPDAAAPEPEPVVYGYNVLDIDFDWLIQNETNSSIIAIHEYISSLQPSSQNEYTGLFAGKNLILICAEAFTDAVIDPVMTPTLYRLSRNGFYFSDFYQPAWGGGTAGGEFSILAGFPPTESSMSTLIASAQNTSYMISTRLQSLGYFTASFHNGTHTYYQRNESHPNIGYGEYIAFGSGLNELMGKRWSASDVDLMEATVPYYINSNPFSVYYMTYSGHASYTINNTIANRNWNAFPEQYSKMSDPIRAYMAANLEFEYAMAYLVAALEEAGIADDTVIVIGSDHYPYGLMQSEIWGSDRSYIPELFGVKSAGTFERDQSAGIIWSGCLENEFKDLAVEINTPVSTLDLMPTLMNLFGLEFDSRFYVGRDVLSEAVPLVFWLNRSWVTQAGKYSASNGNFVPASDDIEIPEDYVSIIKSIVNNRISYSRSVLKLDYFSKIFNDDGTLRYNRNSQSDNDDRRR